MEKKQKIGKILIWIMLGLLATFLFLWLIHPVLSYTFTPPFSYHSGVKHYTSGKYVKFEDGELFRDFTESLDFVDDGEVVDFFHANYWMRDNPFYGKASDYFILDLSFEETEYIRIKEFLENESTYRAPVTCGDYWCYRQHNEENTTTYVIAYRDEYQIMRVCLITEHDSDIVTRALIGDTPGWRVD